MIDSRELRIGNLIYEESAVLAGNNMLQKVKSISEDTIGVESDLLGVKLTRPQYCSPIPLTPEILIAAGFENDGGEFQHPDNTDFDLMFYCSENGLWCAYNFGDRKTSVPFVETTLGVVSLPICNPFKYVHQLQNLYFALTQTEITINLK